ncbi:hypothetical protein D3C85_1637220 [compost metagenome]
MRGNITNGNMAAQQLPFGVIYSDIGQIRLWRFTRHLFEQLGKIFFVQTRHFRQPVPCQRILVMSLHVADHRPNGFFGIIVFGDGSEL